MSHIIHLYDTVTLPPRFYLSIPLESYLLVASGSQLPLGYYSCVHLGSYPEVGICPLS